jgi:hypothetical protein
VNFFAEIVSGTSYREVLYSASVHYNIKATSGFPLVASFSERPPPQLKEKPDRSCFAPPCESLPSVGQIISCHVAFVPYWWRRTNPEHRLCLTCGLPVENQLLSSVNGARTPFAEGGYCPSEPTRFI